MVDAEGADALGDVAVPDDVVPLLGPAEVVDGILLLGPAEVAGGVLLITGAAGEVAAAVLPDGVGADVLLVGDTLGALLSLAVGVGVGVRVATDAVGSATEGAVDAADAVGNATDGKPVGRRLDSAADALERRSEARSATCPPHPASEATTMLIPTPANVQRRARVPITPLPPRRVTTRSSSPRVLLAGDAAIMAALGLLTRMPGYRRGCRATAAGPRRPAPG
ncbi:MAG: hypothetical protein EPO13_04315 [Actinomycetota bacterium]|nr:MAG: hypothetical protein EPO13_04315 [Actinomycetota bacterium]